MPYKFLICPDTDNINWENAKDKMMAANTQKEVDRAIAYMANALPVCPIAVYEVTEVSQLSELPKRIVYKVNESGEIIPK